MHQQQTLKNIYLLKQEQLFLQFKEKSTNQWKQYSRLITHLFKIQTQKSQKILKIWVLLYLKQRSQHQSFKPLIFLLMSQGTFNMAFITQEMNQYPYCSVVAEASQSVEQQLFSSKLPPLSRIPQTHLKTPPHHNPYHSFCSASDSQDRSASSYRASRPAVRQSYLCRYPSSQLFVIRLLLSQLSTILWTFYHLFMTVCGLGSKYCLLQHVLMRVISFSLHLELLLLFQSNKASLLIHFFCRTFTLLRFLKICLGLEFQSLNLLIDVVQLVLNLRYFVRYICHQFYIIIKMTQYASRHLITFIKLKSFLIVIVAINIEEFADFECLPSFKSQRYLCMGKFKNNRIRMSLKHRQLTV